MLGLLLICMGWIIRTCFKCELAFDLPWVICHVIDVQILITVVPTDDVQKVVEAKHIIAERTDFRQCRVPFHQVLVNVKAETFLCPYGFIEASKNHDCLVVYRHTHSEITSCPSWFTVQIYHSPHIVVHVVHFYCFCDLFLIKLCPTTENVDVLVIKNTASGTVSCYIQISDSRPSIVLNIVLFAGSVKTFRVITSYHKY